MRIKPEIKKEKNQTNEIETVAESLGAMIISGSQKEEPRQQWKIVNTRKKWSRKKGGIRWGEVKMSKF